MEINEETLYREFGIDPEPANPEVEVKSEPETPEVDTNEVEETVGVDTTDVEETENTDNTDTGSEQTVEERRQNAARRRQQERQAEIDKAVNEAREQERQIAKQQQQDFFKRAKLKNTLDGTDITTIEEFDAWEKEFNQRKLERDLKSGKLTPEDIGPIIEQNETVRAARQIVEREQQAAMQKQIDAELAEINKIDPNIKTTKDLLNMPNSKEFYDLVINNHLSFKDAYFLVNREKVQNAAAVAAKNQAMSNQRGKDHLTGMAGARGAGAASVPADEMKLFRFLNPNATDAEIQAYYNKK